MMTSQWVHETAANLGFEASIIIPGEWADDCPPNMSTLVLLIKAYKAEKMPEQHMASIHPYYFASQQAYVQTKKMVKLLEDMGETVQHCHELSLIPLCSHLNCFKLGRNSLLYYDTLGSRFHIQCIAIKNKLPCDHGIFRIKSVFDMCDGCTRCQNACPTKAICSDGVNGGLCLRNHMLVGAGAEESYRAHMKNRLIGCDNCQASCPYNEKPVSEPGPGAIPIEDLLPPSAELIKQLSDKIGSNLTIVNRLCAQACLNAGNSHDPRYVPQLQELIRHPSPAVSACAKWALECIFEA